MSEATEATAQAALNADIATSAPANAAAVLTAFGALFGPQQTVSLMESVEALVAQVQNGDLSVIEQMLLSQAVALQGVFTSLTFRSANQTNPRLLQAQLGLALRAQSQARAALEALIELKQPSSPTYIGQANIAGQQQVNNGVTIPVSVPNSARFDQNRLLEAHDEQRLDRGAETASGRDDPVLATVDALDGSENGGRQGAHQDERGHARPDHARGLGSAAEIE